MATITSGNWSFRDPGDEIPSGSTISGGNFSQLVPGTAILTGKTLTITGGNFCNVLVDVNWTINGGNWTQVSMCSHLHTDWISKGLAECVANCSHVIAADEIVVDGVVVETVYTYKDTVQ